MMSLERFNSEVCRISKEVVLKWSCRPRVLGRRITCSDRGGPFQVDHDPSSRKVGCCHIQPVREGKGGTEGAHMCTYSRRAAPASQL